MTTGLIYAVIFYVASLILGGIGAYFYSGGDWMKGFEFFQPIARYIGPALIAPLGFVIGFFKEKRLQRVAEEEARKNEMRPRAASPTPAPQPAGADNAAPEEKSEEVKAYLEQTTNVDMKGIKDFVQQTRKHNLTELHSQANSEEEQGKDS